MTATYSAAYDAWNRLVEVKDGANVVLKCEYDGLGRRTKKFVNTSDPLDQTYDAYRHFFYSAAWQILETRKTTSENDAPDGANPEYQFVWSARYVDAPVLRDRDSDGDGEAGDGSLGKTDSGLDERLFYVTDANFNVTALVQGTPGDADLGKVVERYACDPYGRVLVLDGADGVDPDTTAGDPDEEWQVDADGASDVANEILFCGYRLDPETSLYHVRHRMYHPTLGRCSRRKRVLRRILIVDILLEVGAPQPARGPGSACLDRATRSRADRRDPLFLGVPGGKPISCLKPVRVSAIMPAWPRNR